MILKIRLGMHKLVVTFSKIEDVVGVNSLLEDGTHILMWDFDYEDEEKVIAVLEWEQAFWKLPNIYVLKTAEEKGFHAYCLTRVPFLKACAILADTNLIDETYYRMGVFRKKWTLRISEKSGRSISLHKILKSDVPEDVSVKELTNFVAYETLPDGVKSRIIKLGCD